VATAEASDSGADLQVEASDDLPDEDEIRAVEEALAAADEIEEITEAEVDGDSGDAEVVSETAGDVEFTATPLDADDAVFDVDGREGTEAVLTLMQLGERDAWVDRAKWLYREAPEREQPEERASALLVVSELYAMAGEEEQAETVAREAVELAPSSPLAYRQLRGILMAKGSWTEVADALDAEARVAPSAGAKLHANCLGAEVARLLHGDADAANRRLDQAVRAVGDDLRPQITRLAQRLASTDELGEVSLTGEGVDGLSQATEVLKVLRSDGAEGEASSSPFALLLSARAALRKRDLPKAIDTLGNLEQLEEFAAGAAWLTSAIAAPHGELREHAIEALGRVSEGSHGAMATRAQAQRAIEAGDTDTAVDVANAAGEKVLTVAERLVISALSGERLTDLEEFIRRAVQGEVHAPLAAATAAVLTDPKTSAREVLDVGELLPRAAVALGRELAAAAQHRVVSSPSNDSEPAPESAPEVPEAPDSVEMALGGAVVKADSDSEVGDDSPTLPPAPAEDERSSATSDPSPPSSTAGAYEHLGLGMALRDRATELLEVDPVHGAARAVLLEHCYETKQVGRVAEALLESAELSGGLERERALASALLADIAGNQEQMLVDVDRALNAAPEDEAALRMSLSGAESTVAAANLTRFAESLDDPVRAALAYTEAGLGLMEQEGEEDAGEALLRRASEAQPDIPVAAFIGKYVAQAMGDDEGERYWLDQQRSVATEPGDAVAVTVRQALRLSADENEARAALLEEAHRALPADYCLRGLYEQAAGVTDDRAVWLSERLAAEGSDAAVLGLEAALASELTGDIEQAAASVSKAQEAGDDQLAPVFALRYAHEGHGTEAVVESLSAQIRQAQEPVQRRGLLTVLAGLEAKGQGDSAQASAALRSIIEDSPGDLPALFTLKSMLMASGSEEGLADVALSVARALDGPEAVGHAMLAARLRQASGDWDGFAEPVQIAFESNPNSIWAMRQMAALARSRGDHGQAAAVDHELADAAAAPIDEATLLLRGAQANLARGDDEGAAVLLGDVVDLWPRHPIALLERASLLERVGAPADAADAHEAAALACQGPKERAARLYKAATLWLSLDDQVGQAEGRRLLEAVAEVDPAYEDAFERLQAIYLAAGAKRELAALLASRLDQVTDPDERVRLEVMRGRVLVQAGAPTEARFALSAALEASPDNPDALSAYADVCAAEEDWDAVEQTLIQLGRLVADPEQQCDIYLRLGALYDEPLPNLERAEQAYQQVLKLAPDNTAAREKLVDLALRSGDTARAFEQQQGLIEAASSPHDKCLATVRLAEIHEAAGDLKQAEQTLVKARRTFSREARAMQALYDFYRRTGQDPAADMLLERAQAEVKRGLNAGRFEPALFAMVKVVAGLRNQADAAAIAEASLAAIQGEPAYVDGAGPLAGQPELDEHLAPDVFTPSFRSLLGATGALMEAAVPFNLQSLRAKPLPPHNAAVVERTREIAAGYGLPDVEVVCTNALQRVCVPARVEPPTLCFGLQLVTADNEPVREFLIHRALKVLQSRTAPLSRTAPIDLWPLVAAYLKLHSPSFEPQGVDPGKVNEFLAKMKAGGTPPVNPQVNLLASEVIGGIGNRASSLNTVSNSWGSRAALLAIGDPNVALEAVSWAHGAASGPPTSGPDRIKWIGRQAEARDLIAFSVSDGYTAARAVLGLEAPESIEVEPV